MPKATLGRIVHYVLGGSHYAAIISLVDGDQVILHMFNPCAESGVDTVNVIQGVHFDASCSEGTWHWPEKV